MSILITGGAGFIGSHMAGLLLKKNIDFVLLDNFSNSNLSNLERLESKFKKKIKIYEVDLRDIKALDIFFKSHQINSVIHFAALKSVEESQKKPNLYYQNNVIGSLNLFENIKKNKIKRLIFSSSACVYGEPKYLPIDEEHPIAPMNNYGQNKADIENFLLNDDYFNQYCCTNILRYFNPIGSFYDGVIGENHVNEPNNLMPYILGVATKKFPFLKIYGDDYPTSDGTAIRDYIHIMDLVEAHYILLDSFSYGINIFNVGTGYGYSVMDIIETFQEVNHIKIPYKFYNRREGDVTMCYSNPKKIKLQKGWSAKYDLRKMCWDAFLYANRHY